MNYTHRQTIYSGPSATVERAQLPDGTVIALKIIDVDFIRRPHSLRGELAILDRVRGNHRFAQILHHYRHGDDHIIEQQFYTRLDLSKVLESHVTSRSRFNQDGSVSKVRKNTLPSAIADTMVIQMADALQHLHELGIIHRDIKPSNWFFDESLTHPVLGDFGISYDTSHPPSDEPLNGKCLDVSTGVYKAPELCFGVTDYAFEIDVWSLAIVITLLYLSDGTAALSIPTDGNDFALIKSIFETFGTPTVSDKSSECYWPKMLDEKYHFQKFEFQKYPRQPTSQLVPRCENDAVVLVLGQMTVYEGRLSASQVYEALRASAP